MNQLHASYQCGKNGTVESVFLAFGSLVTDRQAPWGPCVAGRWSCFPARGPRADRGGGARCVPGSTNVAGPVPQARNRAGMVSEVVREHCVPGLRKSWDRCPRGRGKGEESRGMPGST